MSTISTGTSLTTAFVINGDTTGELVVKTGSSAATALTVSATGNLSLATGNLTFSSTGQRITGDMSNATVSNRLAFQTSTTNSATRLMAIPNGTSTTTAFNVLNSSDPNNASWLSVGVSNTETAINATISGTGTYLPMIFLTGGSERMRIDSSGNVGIGTASPSFKFEVQQGSSSASPSLRQTPQVVLKGYGGSSTYHSGIGFSMFEHTNGYWGSGILEVDDSGSYGAAMAFYTSTGSATPTPSERMRITSGGEVYIAGTTDQGAYNLQCNGTGVWGAGAYVNGSDARLKDNIQSLDSGLDVVKAMRPVTFQYKPDYSKDQSIQPGFIAQELQTAMAGKPYLEGVVQEGPNHLNVAYQNIIPILVKAMQEQQDQIKALQDKIAALEAK